MGTGLVEAFSEPCPHCGGRGLVLHDLPVVASPIEDNFSDRRSSKATRRRGRDAERVEEIVVPRVVEQAVGRRPDPRGPRGPIPAGLTGAGRQDAPDEVVSEVVGEAVPTTAVLTREGGAEIDWITAAASAGIQAAEDADEDGFEAHQPGSGAGPDDEAPIELDEIVVEVNGDGFPPGDDAAGQDDARPEYSLPPDTLPPDSSPAEAHATVQDDVPAGATGPALDEAAPAPERRRRGRRSAGRPAGAPPAAQPVDMVIRETVREPQESRTASSSERPPDDHGTNGHDEHSAPTDGNGVAEAPVVAAEPVVEPVAAPPRRRRAASRPAGPAAGVSAPEPVVISIPAESIPAESIPSGQPVS